MIYEYDLTDAQNDFLDAWEEEMYTSANCDDAEISPQEVNENIPW